jgi:hypothetical protein
MHVTVVSFEERLSFLSVNGPDWKSMVHSDGGAFLMVFPIPVIENTIYKAHATVSESL